MRHLLGILLLVVSLAAIAAGCSRRPPLVLSEKQMASLLADLHEAEGLADQNYSTYRNDSSRAKLRAAVYAKHEVTPEIVDSSLAWYGYHAEKYMDVYDRVLAILEDRMANVKEDVVAKSEASEALSVDGDSAVVWRSYGATLFSPRIGRRLLAASINSDRYWNKGDRYELKFKVTGAAKPTAARIAYVNYEGKTEAMRHPAVTSGSWYTYKLVTDTAKPARQVSFVIEYRPSPEDIIAAVDSVTLTRIRSN